MFNLLRSKLKICTFFMGIALSLLLSVNSLKAGVLGDVNNDGKIGLTEAIYALQVTAGIKSISQTEGQVLSFVPADSTSQTWKFIKSETLPDFNGHPPSSGKTILKLYFDNDGYVLKMSFKDQNGKELPLFATEMTSKHAVAIIEIDKSTTKAVIYTLSKRMPPF